MAVELELATLEVVCTNCAGAPSSHLCLVEPHVGNPLLDGVRPATLVADQRSLLDVNLDKG